MARPWFMSVLSSLASAVASPAQDCAHRWDVIQFEPYGGATALFSSDFDGTPRLYVSGGIESVDGIPVSNIASWDGTQWSDMAGGLSDPDGSAAARAFAVFDDGHGPALYAAGNFALAGGVPASSIARWDGVQWRDVGGGVRTLTPPYSGLVACLQVWDDGTGPALYAGGWFTVAGEVEVSGIARWNGHSWSDVGGGTYGSIASMTVWNDGDDESLYCGGNFIRAGGEPVRRLAKWDGTQWHDVGGGVGIATPSDEVVFAIAAWDDGTGPALYVGGRFWTVNGQDGYYGIAKWDGQTWQDLAEGYYGFAAGEVRVMAILDDGHGPALHMSGSAGPFFTNDGYGGVYRREKGEWIGLGDGPKKSYTYALAQFDIGGVPTIWAGGTFKQVGKKQGWGLAFHQGGVPEQPADANRDGVLEYKDYNYFRNNLYDFNGDGTIDLFDILAYFNAYNAACP